MVDEMTHQECLELTNQFSTHNYHPLPISIATAEGAWVTDVSGKRYIDCVGSYSAVAMGHLCESINDAAKQQLDILALTSRAVYTREMALFVKALCEYAETDMACPMNTGAEAVETAIKLARKWGYTKKGVPDGKAEIIVAEGNFHGRTTTIVGFSSEPNYKANFGPFPAGFIMVPFGDLDAVKAAITPNTVGVLMEPIQAEGGIIMPPDGFMAGLRSLCTENNVLLIWDEIQTGMCRTGEKFAWQHEDAEPDMMCLGKALGGGIFPVAATVGKREVMEVFKPGDHGSTFGGNPLGSVIAIAAMAELESSGLCENSRRMGEVLKRKFLDLNHPAVLEVRGRGLLIGLEVKESVDDKRLGDSFLEQGILTKETRHRTFRFAPPLSADLETINEIATRVEKALSAVA